MKSILTILAVLMAVSFSLDAQPKLTVNAEKIDLGTVYNGKTVAAEIKLTNAGKDTLKIISVQPSCGCTTVKQPKSAMAPGESDVAKVEFNSTGFRGHATKYVNITTNDPQKPYITVTLNAEVKEELEPATKSSVLWLGSIPIGKTTTESVSFNNISDKQITIKGVIAKNPAIAVSFEPKTVKPSEVLKVTFTVTQQKEGYLNEEIILETDSKNQSRVPLRISLVGVKPS